MVELRGELEGRSASADAGPAALLGGTSTVTRSLREWLPQDSDGSVAATTAMLMHLGVFDNMDRIVPGGGLPDQLVRVPTTRFVHRAVIAMKHATGYPPGIVEDWPELQEAKLDFVTKVWSCVRESLNLQDEPFDAEGVLKCTNRKGARRLLQLVAIAASRERGHQRQPGPVAEH